VSQLMTPRKNNSEKSEIFILDTNIFLLGAEFTLLRGDIYTSPQILAEIKNNRENRTIINRLQAAMDTGRLKVQKPSEETLKKVVKKSKETGDYRALSEADNEILALALDFKENSINEPILYSNDYSIQNLCAELGLRFASLHRTGIKSKIVWEVYCPHCKTTFSPEYLNRVCERCGSKLKRRPKR